MSGAIDAFLAHYYARHPVNATFTGMHAHDAQLPDWSNDARADEATERGALRAGLASETSLDAELARANLDVRGAEHDSGFMIGSNPSLWVGEAIFGAVSLMLRPFAPRADRLVSLAARLAQVEPFLATMRASVAPAMPSRWIVRARKECHAATALFGEGLDMWLALESFDAALATRVRAAGSSAQAAFRECEAWLASRQPASTDDCACGDALFDVLLRRGHFCDTPASELLRQALAAIGPAKAQLDAFAKAAAGSWTATERLLAADRPADGDYVDAFGRTWNACRALSAEHDLVSWPEWPLRYVPIPEWARASAPHLYWLFYRSPAPLDAYTVHDYVVPPGASNSVIKLNHVVHHGALGHHVQNWHATHRSQTAIGTRAAVDCASRIGMFLGGSFAEGWACYATELMDELGFLSPLERAAQQQSRVRMLARAIVDIRLHTRGLSAADAVAYYVQEVGMTPAAAESEVTKNSMFPCTALMYWLGTQGILDLRDAVRQKRGPSFTLRTFHDELLSYGAIPVPLVARLMTKAAA